MSINYIDPSISNGTCWSGPNQRADHSYIPCGNDAYGFHACCQARDICLSSNACYNGLWGVTYLAGCSDHTYQSGVCPNKALYAAQQWVGLVRCFASNDTNSKAENWAGCVNHEEVTVTSPLPCTCTTSSDPVLFTAAPALTNIASLPVSISNAIAWYNGFTPATTAIAAPSRASPSISVQSTTSSQSRSTISSSVSPARGDHSLSTSTKVGIGVGVGVGVAVFCVALGALLFWQRKKCKTVTPPVMDQIRPRSQIDPAFHDKSHADIRNSTFSGYKSELAADEIGPSNQRMGGQSSSHESPNQHRASPPGDSLISEVKGSPVVAKPGGEDSDIRYELPG